MGTGETEALARCRDINRVLGGLREHPLLHVDGARAHPVLRRPPLQLHRDEQPKRPEEEQHAHDQRRTDGQRDYLGPDLSLLHAQWGNGEYGGDVYLYDDEHRAQRRHRRARGDLHAE